MIEGGGSGTFYAAKWKIWINKNTQRDGEIMIFNKQKKRKKGKILAGQTFGSTLSGSTTRLRGCPPWGTLLRAYLSFITPSPLSVHFLWGRQNFSLLFWKITIQFLYKLRPLTNEKIFRYLEYNLGDIFTLL